MQITKTSTADGFVVVDLPEAATATGIVRCARKILQDGAVNLARSLTYSYAAFGIPTSGASAGINADGDGRDAAVEAFVAELTPRITDGSLSLTPGKGVTATDVAAWSTAVPAEAGPDVATDAGPDVAALAAGVVAATGAATDLAGTSVVVEASAPGADAIVAAFGAAGAEASALPLTDLLGAGAAVVVVGSKPGVLDHENIASLGGAVIVGAAAQAVTARALATGRRNGATILPDFVTSAGPLLAGAGEPDPGARIAAAVTAVLDHDEGPYLGACYAAEDFLRTWATALPFGRPLA